MSQDSKAQKILKLFEISKPKILKFDPEKPLDKDIYMQITDQMRKDKSYIENDIWYPVVLDNGGKKKQVEAMYPSKGNLMFRTARKPEIVEEDNLYRIVYDLYKFNNKGVIQNPSTSYGNFDSKTDLIKALEPFKKQ